MAEISAPWGGISVGDAGPYTDQKWAQLWRDMFRASKSDSGPLLGSGTSPDPGLTVQQTGVASASVDITVGSAIVRGTWYNTSANVNKAIAANASGNPRIDTVVLRKDYTAQTVRLAVLQGTPAGSPVAPSLTQVDGTTWEIPLADIAVANGFVTITNANITPRTHWANAADGVYLNDVLNNSGGLLQTGDVVVWDTTADRAVKTSTTLGDGLIAGIWVGRTAAGGYGRVLVRGIGYVNASAAVATRGLTLVQSGTAKQAAVQGTADTVSKLNAIGISLAITGGAGLVLSHVDVRAMKPPAVVTAESTTAFGTTTATAWSDVHATAKVTITPNSTRVKVTMWTWTDTGGTGQGFFSIRNNTTGVQAGDVNEGLANIPNASASFLTMVGIFTGLTPGTSYEFRFRFRAGTAGQAVSTGNHFEAIAEEI